MGVQEKKYKILVVDDEDDIVELLKYALKDEFELTTAIDGQEAIKMMEASSPDLIITDIYMPILNGLDLIKEVKKNSLIPIIVISGSRLQDKANFFDTQGVSHILEKPFSIRQLKAKIRSILEPSLQAQT